MKESELDNIRAWFNSYAGGFALADGSMHLTHDLKLEHSHSVAAECRAIAEALEWSAPDLVAAEALGILHDVGRFRQFQQYGTLVDAKSVNHGELGHDVVLESGILASCDARDADRILNGVRYHNRRKLVSGLSPDAVAFLKLIRDADKLDIIRVVTEFLRSGKFDEHPEILLNVDMNGPANPALIADIAGGRSGNYAHVRSLADMHLMRMSWVYDMNYLPSLRLMVSRGPLGELKGMLPDTVEIRHAMKVVNRYVEESLRRE